MIKYDPNEKFVTPIPADFDWEHLSSPEYFNFAIDVIDRMAQRDRNRLAMIWANQVGDEKRFTFFDLSLLSNQAANMLLEIGVSRGDRLFMMIPRIPEWWIFALAAMKIGAVFCPAPTLLTPHDIEHRVKYGNFKYILSDRENADKVEAAYPNCPTLKERILVDSEREGWISFPMEQKHISRHAALNIHNFRTRAKDPMLLIFTSGTSKMPKMVMHTYDAAIGYLINGGLWHGLTDQDVHWTVSDTGWGKNLWGNIFGQWICGACIFIYDIRGKFRGTDILPVIEKYGITSFCAPPTIYRMLVLNDLKKYNFSCLRSCTAAGEPLHLETVKLWKDGTGITIREAYGQTETTAVIGNFCNAEVKPGTMGKASPNWKLELHDDDGRPVPQGEVGRIAVKISDGLRPLGLLERYVGGDEEAENAKYFVNGFYYTGDKARLDEDGYYWFCGRNDDIIKSSGYRISPQEVEEAIMTYPAVREVAVVGAPDPVRGVIIKAYIILRPGFEPSEDLIRDIQRHTREETAPYKYPRAVEFVKELPKTFSGKIKRDVLRKHAENGGPLICE